jgi:two-component system response regulator AtoC
MNNYHILIIEDEQNLNYFLSEGLKEEGYNLHSASNLEEGRNLLKKQHPDLILLDIKLPDGNGIEFLRDIKSNGKQVNVLMMTAYGSINQAVEAIRLGAIDYLSKPFDLDELKIKIDKIRKTDQLKNELAYLYKKEEKFYDQEYLVCHSSRMKTLYSLVDKVANSGCNSILVQGESGTGKEMIARMIHKHSERSNKALVDLNCAAVPEQFIESELFGHEQGAFTGATKKKLGLLQIADKSIIIFDEISEMPFNMQVKILRVLETQTIRRLGSVNDIKVDFRTIALTNRDLGKCVDEGNFREDLLYRLNMFLIEVPALREHKEDLPELLMFFIEKFAKKNHKNLTITSEAINKLMEYDWPGNIRELRNVIERAVIIAEGKEINSDHLYLNAKPQKTDSIINTQEIKEGINLKEFLEKAKNNAIKCALENSGNNQAKAAQLLNVPRHVIRYFLEKNQN